MWLAIFLDYALRLAQDGDTEGAYETITAATDANVFYHKPDFMYLINVCWFSEHIFPLVWVVKANQLFSLRANC